MLGKIINRSDLAKISLIISRSTEFLPIVSNLSDREIKDKFTSYRNSNLDKKTEDLPFLIALVGEVFHRVEDITPYPEQFICAVALYMGYISEMKTGEGKSITATIAAILCSLHGQVHIVTVNDYLAKRDYEKMLSIYEMLGLSCGANERGYPDKKKLYESNIVYSSSMELIFDYLRNQIVAAKEKINFPLDTVIIDEIDFVLLDNANSTFSISAGEDFHPSLEVFQVAKEICTCLKGEEREKEDFFENIPDTQGVHFIYFRHNRMVYLTDDGLSLIENLFGIKNLMSQNLKLYRAIIYTLEANLFHLNGRDYIVKDKKVVLINKENGRLMLNSQLEADLHTAIEVKEGLEVTHRHILTNSLSYQIFFTQYNHMVGMSGTIYEAKDEFEGLFDTPIIVIPMHRPNRRKDHPDIFLKTLKDKYDFLSNYLTKIKSEGQPVLIIAGSEKEADKVYEIVKHHHRRTTNLLSAQSAEEEEQLVKSAGAYDTITISTNMAGRGTDIILDQKSKEAGGLMVIVLNHYESERIDNQVRGRAGRQGDEGECLFVVSLEDDIWTHLDAYQKNKVEKIVLKYEFPLPERACRELQHILKKIQKTNQSMNSKTRQMIFALGSIIEKQRKIVIEWKEELKEISVTELIKQYVSSKEFDLNELKKTWEKRASHISIDFECLEQHVEEQCVKIGYDTAKALFETLLDKIFDIEWLQFKYDLEYVKSYLPLYRLTEEQSIMEYMKICDEQYRLFRKNVMINMIGYFLTAKVRQVECM